MAMGIRNIRMDVAEWDEWKEAAAAEGLTCTDLIRREVREAVRVIRGRQTTNNATPAPASHTERLTQSSGLGVVVGGEAKGATDESTAKPGGPQSG